MFRNIFLGNIYKNQEVLTIVTASFIPGELKATVSGSLGCNTLRLRTVIYLDS